MLKEILTPITRLVSQRNATEKIVANIQVILFHLYKSE